MRTKKEKVEKQDLKRKRIKTFFLEAAMEIIIQEGVEKVSVRKVADKAGYSYATIYNYFADLSELLLDAKGLMFENLFEYIREKINDPIRDNEGIKKLFRTYIEYYFRNPNVFKFFYLYHLSGPSKEAEGKKTGPDFGEMQKETFKNFVIEGKLQEKHVETVAKIFIYAVHGMLTLSFSENGYLAEENVYKELEIMVDYLLSKAAPS